MPLSDHEQKMLEAMERALYAEDPKFATQMNGRNGGPTRTRLVIGIVAALIGLALVVVGVWTQTVIVGGLGFAVMVAGVAWAINPTRGGLRSVTHRSGTGERPSRKAGSGPAATRPASGPRASKPKSSGTFMQRMEERWERRRREGR